MWKETITRAPALAGRVLRKDTEMDTQRIPPRAPVRNPSAHDELLTEVRGIREECRALKRLFYEFARVYLAAKFPYGKPTDRWGRR
jgi:hypothetical protein